MKCFHNILVATLCTLLSATGLTGQYTDINQDIQRIYQQNQYIIDAVNTLDQSVMRFRDKIADGVEATKEMRTVVDSLETAMASLRSKLNDSTNQAPAINGDNTEVLAEIGALRNAVANLRSDFDEAGATPYSGGGAGFSDQQFMLALGVLGLIALFVLIFGISMNNGLRRLTQRLAVAPVAPHQPPMTESKKTTPSSPKPVSSKPVPQKEATAQPEAPKEEPTREQPDERFTKLRPVDRARLQAQTSFTFEPLAKPEEAAPVAEPKRSRKPVKQAAAAPEVSDAVNTATGELDKSDRIAALSKQASELMLGIRGQDMSEPQKKDAEERFLELIDEIMELKKS